MSCMHTCSCPHRCSSSPCLLEGDSYAFLSAMMSLSKHRLPNSWAGFTQRANIMESLDWMSRFRPLCLLCLPLETELVNIPPNKSNSWAHGQNPAILSTGLRLWWPSHTNVIIIRTSQHYVAFPHPPHVHSIEWIFFFIFPHFFFPLFPFFWHTVYQRERPSAEHCMPDASLWHFVEWWLAFSMQALI